MQDTAVEVRVAGQDRLFKDRLFNHGGERLLIRMSSIGCLFPDHHQLRTTDGYVLKIAHEDWDKLEREFRRSFPEVDYREGA